MMNSTNNNNNNNFNKESLLSAIYHSTVFRQSASCLPNHFNFHYDNAKQQQHLYYLARLESETNVNGLYRVTIPSTISDEILEGELVLAGLEKSTTKNDLELSKEEQLLRERTRTVAYGITDYKLHNESNMILMTKGTSIYLYNIETQDLHQVPSTLVPDVAKIDAKFSPASATGASNNKKRPQFVSFIGDNDLYVVNLDTEKEIRLTNKSERKDRVISNGMAEFIMQEEFSRYTGYWWSPSNKDGKYRIAYLEVDETDVPIVNIPQTGYNSSVDSYRYPRPGENNAKSTLCIADLSVVGPDNVEVSTKRFEGLLEANFGWYEYVARCGWADTEGESLWLLLLDRKQQHSALVTFDLRTEKFNVIYEERSDTWINVSDLIYFFKDGSGRLIRDSERTGFRHLYLYEKDSLDGSYKDSPITQGDGWQVDDDGIWVDEKRQVVYFLGTKDSCVEKHLYVASFASSSSSSRDLSVTRLTELGFYFSGVTFNDDKSAFAVLYSSISSAPVFSLYTLLQDDSAGSGNDNSNNAIRFQQAMNIKYLSNKDTATITLGAHKHQWSASVNFSLSIPDMFDFQNKHGDKIYGCVYKPPAYDPAKKYPTIVHIYGGPHVQLVRNAFGMVLEGRLQLLAHLGFVVVIIDGRGSSRRGLKFEGHLRCRMGQFELEDQVEGVEYLIKQFEAKHPHGVNIDRSRIGIFGWSYGGYMSLMAIAQRPDFFKVAVSGAPVTDWALYDTGYTERYMDMPQNNPEGYKLGSVMHYAHNIPEEDNRLLMIHGLMDENVHFKHTEVLIDKLVALQKPYNLKVYPKERHGVRALDSQLHFMYTMITFLQKNL